MKNISTYFKNMKIQILSLLSILFIFALFKQQGNTDVSIYVTQLIFSVLIAVCAEFAIFGKMKLTSIHSAMISGVIIALLLAPGTDLTIIWFASFTAIASKKLFQLQNGKHIFNPASFGLLLTTVFLGNKINWWGLSSPYIIIVLGGIILYRLNRLSLVFSYIIFRCIGVLAFNGLDFSIENLMLHNLFFAFIMLIEPKTSPFKRKEQWIFAGGAGFLASLFFVIIPSYGGDILSLLCMNLIFSMGIISSIIKKISFHKKTA